MRKSKIMRTILKKWDRQFSTINSPCLVRDFIYDRLYHPTQGYFCRNDVQIGELESPINFKNMIGYQDYMSELSEKYPKNAWLTPSEQFRPWYGMTIGNYMHGVIEMERKNEEIRMKMGNLKNSSLGKGIDSSQMALIEENMKNETKKKMSEWKSVASESARFDDKTVGYKTIRIIEAGAGSGSAADSILLFFKNFEQKYYANIQYHIVELSPQMCKRARAKLEKEHKRLLDRGNIKIINDDISNYKPEPNLSGGREINFMLFLEVLDNMTHDRVYFSEKEQKFASQTLVEFDDLDGNSNIRELRTPITDALVQECLQYYLTCDKKDVEEPQASVWEKVLIKLNKSKGEKNVFLPTGCLRTLKNLKKNIVNPHFIFADFDLLTGAPSAKIGINAPIVSRKLEKSSEKKDFNTYLIERGAADIFFPTNFRLLAEIHKNIFGKKAESIKSYEFMNNFAKEKWTETKSGYNPLKEDFMNTSFLVTSLD